MSMQDLVGGAGCDDSQNALGRFAGGISDAAKYAEGHHSAAASSAGAGYAAPSFSTEQQEAEEEMRQFLAANDPDGRLQSEAGLEGGAMNPLDFMSFPESMDWSAEFWNEQAGLERGPNARQYPFKEENLFLADPAAFEHGMELFHAGKLAEAILAFEAVVQKNPENSDAWRWLGTAHAENDEDKVAIVALQRSLAADGSNIEALLDLGVSYTNELVQGQALQYLKEWLRHHEEYRGIPGVMEPSSKLHSLRHEQVAEMFVRAAEIDPTDVDVFTVLGVLYNLSREYEHAEMAFQQAIKICPTNYSLWNKLGATQANSSRKDGSKQAIAAYRKALELKPNYVRAWVNMGISYANQGLYDLASKYYLKALSMNPTATHIWSYLRISLTCMNRDDLAELTASREVNAFREEFRF
eukprot:TRINITY_DN20707_c0_g1_i1.p1 TRINITY_DN20707_c0_g1~~TRINITY_DN20707_c0_g1_i1.p1  ORF type:complete len:451 (-),score=113.27 TRINITY_DN20707_c0_g1_i1:448-1683(-)